MSAPFYRISGDGTPLLTVSGLGREYDEHRVMIVHGPGCVLGKRSFFELKSVFDSLARSIDAIDGKVPSDRPD